MSSRFALLVAASLSLLAVTACAGTGPTGAAPAASHAPSFAASADVAVAPQPTPVPMPSPSFEPVATPSPNAGDVEQRAAGPELSIELVHGDTIQATLQDPAAKAWRLVVKGVGTLSSDRLEIEIVTGDVGPTIEATEIEDDRVVDVMDLSGFTDGTAAAGGCHRTLSVCIDSDGFRLPDDGDGTMSMRLTLPKAAIPLTITGSTATWPGEPFILGPWSTTESFPWTPG